MIRKLLPVLALAGCSMVAGSTTGPLDASVVCEATQDQFCASGRCRQIERGVQLSTPLSLTVPANANIGQACVATGCEAAYFFPLESKPPEWNSEVRTGDQWSRPMGELTIERVRWTFHLDQLASDGETVWSGACRAQGS
jgi:hypothetical protein